MSAFKWRHLYQMMDTQNVIPYFVEGINNHKHDHGLNLPQDLIDNLKKYLQEQVVKTATNRQQTVEETSPTFSYVANTVTSSKKSCIASTLPPKLSNCSRFWFTTSGLCSTKV